MNRRSFFAALASGVSALAFGGSRASVARIVEPSSVPAHATGAFSLEPVGEFLHITCFEGPSNEMGALSQSGPPEDWLNATPTERQFLFNGGSITPLQAVP